MKTRQKQIDEQLPKPPPDIIGQLAEFAPCFNKLDPDKFMAYIRGEDEPPLATTQGKCSECGAEYGLDPCAVAGCGNLLCEDCACVLIVEYDTLGDDIASICRACRARNLTV